MLNIPLSKQRGISLLFSLPRAFLLGFACVYLHGGKAAVDLEDWLSMQNLLLELLGFGSEDLCGRALWGQI